MWKKLPQKSISGPFLPLSSSGRFSIWFSIFSHVRLSGRFPFCTSPTLDGQNRQSPIASVQRTRSSLASHSAVSRGTNTTRVNGQCFGNPNPYNLSEKYWQYTSNLYGSTPPISIAVLSWLLSFEERETPQDASHLYCSTPPICTAVRPPFVRQHFWKNTGGWGHRNFSEH